MGMMLSPNPKFPGKDIIVNLSYYVLCEPIHMY